MNKQIERGIEILKSWRHNNPVHHEDFIKDIYQGLESARKQLREDPKEDFFYSIHVGGGLDSRLELLEVLTEKIGKDGIESLIIYLLENDNGFTNTDTFENYQDYKPYPSYLVYFAYIIIFDSPKGSTPKSIYTRKLFDFFWEYQAKIRPGINVQMIEPFIQPFIDNGAVSLEDL
ncbi:hypothetical protein JKY72_05005, partial [Candidatus Gracilibacteria bacterium]|nr:hypothetical protein [Candidatus Gracilibacteria bacterium]